MNTIHVRINPDGITCTEVKIMSLDVNKGITFFLEELVQGMKAQMETKMRVFEIDMDDCDCDTDAEAENCTKICPSLVPVYPIGDMFEAEIIDDKTVKIIES